MILHVRRGDSPFGLHTIWFRDWLRAHDHERDRYADIKQQLAAAHAEDGDFDDYTRAKTSYLDDVQPLFEGVAAVRGADCMQAYVSPFATGRRGSPERGSREGSRPGGCRGVTRSP